MLVFTVTFDNSMHIWWIEVLISLKKMVVLLDCSLPTIDQ